MAHHIFDPPGDISDYGDRFQTMSIASVGDSTVVAKRRERTMRDPINVHDIAGAKPKQAMAFKELRNRPTYHEPADVKGSAPKTLHPSLNKVSTVCYNGDIEGSMPKPATFSTKRVVDPMAPQYKLPRAPVKVEPPPKFLRDSHDVSDIAGSGPGKLYKWQQRDSHNVGDIDGTSSSWQPQNKKLLSGKARDLMAVSDINGSKFKTTRVTDPLRPTHVINGMTVSDDDPRMAPKPLPKGRGGPNLSLTTADIEGANCDFKPKHTTPGGIPEHRRRQFRATNRVDDIPGATADTLKRSMQTKRVTDPNSREYPSLDGKVRHVPERMVRKLEDPRDVEIQRLRAEVDSLRKDTEIMRLEKEIESLSGAKSRPPRPTASRSGPATDESERAGLRSSASRASSHAYLRSSASTPVLRSSGGGGGGHGGGHSGGGHGYGGGESYRSTTSSRGGGGALHSSRSRSSLRSSGGDYARVAGTSDILRIGTPGSARSAAASTSRISTARSMSSRAAAEARAELAAVESLPDGPPRSALMSAGSASLRA